MEVRELWMWLSEGECPHMILCLNTWFPVYGSAWEISSLWLLTLWWRNTLTKRKLGTKGFISLTVPQREWGAPAWGLSQKVPAAVVSPVVTLFHQFAESHVSLATPSESASKASLHFFCLGGFLCLLFISPNYYCSACSTLCGSFQFFLHRRWTAWQSHRAQPVSGYQLNTAAAWLAVISMSRSSMAGPSARRWPMRSSIQFWWVWVHSSWCPFLHFFISAHIVFVCAFCACSWWLKVISHCFSNLRFNW